PCAVIVREREPARRLLQVEDPARRIIADRRAEDRLDVAELDAVEAAEALVEHRRVGDDRLPGGERLRDDPARDDGAHAIELLRGEAMTERPARRLGIVAVQLEVPLARVGDLDDQAERLAEERLGLVLATEGEQAAEQVPLTAELDELLAGVGHPDDSYGIHIRWHRQESCQPRPRDPPRPDRPGCPLLWKPGPRRVHAIGHVARGSRSAARRTAWRAGCSRL